MLYKARLIFKSVDEMLRCELAAGSIIILSSALPQIICASAPPFRVSPCIPFLRRSGKEVNTKFIS